MKAMICPSYGAPDVLVFGDWALQSLGPRDVEIAVGAAGIGHPDLLSIAGKYPIPSTPPFVPGIEGAGVVVKTGADCERLRIGDRVCWQHNEIKGSFAQRIVLPENTVAKVPDSVDFLSAACVPTCYGTAWYALSNRGDLKTGQTVVIHGATGGVGFAATQLAHRLGARVIATGSSDDKLSLVKSTGADEVVLVSETLRDDILALAPGGVDLVLDPVGGAVFDQSIRVLAPDGKLLVVGFASGSFGLAKSNILLAKSISVIGVNYGHFLRTNADIARNTIESILDDIARNRYQPLISARYHLTEASRALNQLQARDFVGKIVLDIGGTTNS